VSSRSCRRCKTPVYRCSSQWTSSRRRSNESTS